MLGWWILLLFHDRGMRREGMGGRCICQDAAGYDKGHGEMAEAEGAGQLH